MQEYNYQEIKLEKLEFDEKNYRIIESENQSDALRLLVEKEDTNLIDMAKDITTNGLSPIDITAVVKKEGTDVYTVIEGNRRLAAIRLLENPSLTDNQQIKNALSQLSRDYSCDPIEAIRCTVMPDKETAMRWVDRKQGTSMGGAGLRRADYVHNAIRKADRGEYEKWYAAVRYLRASGHIKAGEVPEREIDKQGTGAAIERVFGTAYLSDKLGINISSNGTVSFDNGDETKGGDLLLSILMHLIEKGLSTDDVKPVEKSEEILQSFLDQNVKKQSQPLPTDNSSSAIEHGEPIDSMTKNKNTNKPEETKDKKPPTTPKPPKKRTKLAPGTLRCPSSVANKRINKLLIELQKLDISETKNGLRLTAGIVMRVFLDLTLTYFLKETKVPVPAKIEAWDSYKAKLPEKLETALKEIDPSRSERKLDTVRYGLNSDFHHSINRLNKQIHALEAPSLTQEECIEYWDRYAPLFDKIFKRLSDND